MRINSRLVFRSRAFWAILALFALLNLLTFFLHPECCDRFDGIGFPLAFHLSGGIAGISEFYPISLLLNVVIAVTVALISARIGLAIGSQARTRKNPR